MSKIAHLSAEAAVSGIILVRSSATVSPDGRGTWNYWYQGTDTGIANFAVTALASGATVIPEYDGSLSSLVVSYSFDPAGAEVPIDDYSIIFDFVSVSVFALPKATNEAASYISPAQYKKDITDQVADGEELSLDTGSYPFAETLYRLLSHGVEDAQILRPIIRRTRSFSNSYATRLTVSYSNTVYTTDQLGTVWGFPSGVLARLPATPTGTDVPAGSAFAWLLEDQTSRYRIASGRWVEEQSFVFAARDTAIYPVFA